MELTILSAAPNCYSTRRLREAAKSRGCDCRVRNTLRFTLDLNSGDPDIYYRGKHFSIPDAVLPRIGASITYYGTAVLRQFEQMDVFTPNSSSGIVNSRDKLRSLQILSRHEIGITRSAFVRQRDEILPAIERVGGAPVIVKLIEGTQGVGVVLAESAKIAQAIVEMLQSTHQNVLIQNFVKESKGRDVRALVVGDRVVASMRRVAQGDEFRSNVHRGGRVEAVDLDPAYEQTAVRAAQIMGLRVAGVDMLESDAGPMIMEINSSPGLEGIEAATHLDVAGAIIDHIADQVSMPDLDIRQKLTVSRGYNVSEISIPEGSIFVGKTIEGTELRNKDIVVLTLKRGTSVISNPKNSRVIEAGDELLCYGKSESMKQLVTPKIKKRKARILKLSDEQMDAAREGAAH
jgi:ribosomal protein S6--L-glutamate ligase